MSGLFAKEVGVKTVTLLLYSMTTKTTREIYVTSTETIYTDNSGIEIHLWGRTETGESDQIIVTDFEPYFYVPVAEQSKLLAKNHSNLERVESCETPSLFEDQLAKVVATHPNGIPALKDKYDTTFEADVVFTNRFRIDSEIYTGVRAPERVCTVEDLEPVELTEAPVQKCFFDIEIDDRGKFPVQNNTVLHKDSAIVSIAAYDSFEEEYHGFISLNQRDVETVFSDAVTTDIAPGCLDTLHPSESEEAMLRDFFSWVSQHNPDILLAWNVGFDMSYLIARANVLGIDPSVMSRGMYPNASQDQYGAEVTGRVVYDLMAAWESMQFSEVSSALENAASMELGDDAGKIKHEESIYELWVMDCPLLMEYNAQDVKLMVEINEEAGVMQDRKELKDAVGADFENTIQANDFIEMLTRRMLHDWNVAGTTKTPPPSDNEEYEGAYTFPAFKGRAKNVVSIDLASLYPFTMWMLNASPECLVDVVDNPKQYVADNNGVTAAPNGSVFDQTEDGLFRELVDKALELTRQAGDRRDSFDPSTDEWAYWNRVREARKRIRNAIYGVLGWVWFFLYDESTAEAVTTMAQVVVKESAQYINEETEGEVIYGDTDSCYISWPDEWSTETALRRTHSVVTTLNDERYPALAEQWGMPAEQCKWEIEMEDASSVFYQAGKKKRYAKSVVWKEGMDFDQTLDEESIKIVGFEYKRSDVAQLTKNIQKDVLTNIVTDADDQEIRERVFEGAQLIQRRNPAWDVIGIPGGIGQKLDEYESETAQVRAAKAANKLLGTEIGKNDKPKRVYLETKSVSNNGETEHTDVLAYEDGTDLDPIADQLYVDTKRMRETIIEKPMERILEPIGIDCAAAMNGSVQKSVSDWV